MADDVDVKKLLLQVDASVELLRKNLAAGEQRVGQFERSVNASMDRADGHFARLGGGLDQVNNHMRTVRAVAAAAIAGGLTQILMDATKRGLEFASGLGETAQQLGVTTKDLQEYRYAASQVGIEQDAMDKALQRLTKTMGQAETGGKAQARVFQQLGIELRSSSGEMKTAGEILPEIADALAKIPDPARRAAVETALFGKAGQQLDTLLAGGAGAVNELRDAAEKLGIVLSDEQIQHADETADKLSELKQVLEARIAGVVSDNAQAIYGLANAIATLTARGLQLVSNFPQISGALAGMAIGGRIGGVPGAAIGATLGAAGGERVAQKQDAQNMSVDHRLRMAITSRRAYDEAKGNWLNQVTPGGQGLIMATQQAAARNQQLYIQALAQAKKQGGAKAPASAVPGLDLDLAGGGGGAGRGRRRGSSGPSQDEIAREFASERAQIRQQLNSAERVMARSADEEAEYEKRSAEEARIRLLDRIDSNKRFSETQKAELRLSVEGLADAERDAIEFRRRGQIERNQTEIDEDVFRAKSDALRDQLDLTDSNAKRRELAQEILDLEYRYRQSMLDAILASETASEQDKARARIARDALDLSHQAASAKANRENESPGQRYLRGLSSEAENLGEAFEEAAVQGMGRLNDSLSESVKNALGLHGVLGDVLGDLAQIAIRQAVIGPLASAIFGGDGLLGGIFGGFRASGGPVDSGSAYVVGEKGPELFVPKVPGNVISNGALGRGGGTSLHLVINAPGATAETVAMMRREIANAAPMLVSAASANTARQMGRRRL